jgi:hypothetical protein
MTLPSNGITAEVIREMMPPYALSTDLLAATFAVLPPPPANMPRRPGGMTASRGWCTKSPGSCRPMRCRRGLRRRSSWCGR